MVIITKHVSFSEAPERDFALFCDYDKNGNKYYGTIDYEDFRKDGDEFVLKRRLNGFDMCIAFEGVADALWEREERIVNEAYLATHEVDYKGNEISPISPSLELFVEFIKDWEHEHPRPHPLKVL